MQPEPVKNNIAMRNAMAPNGNELAAEFIRDMQWDDLPDAVRHQAKTSAGLPPCFGGVDDRQTLSGPRTDGAGACRNG